jgi:hypothetical protein
MGAQKMHGKFKCGNHKKRCQVEWKLESAILFNGFLRNGIG